MKARIAELVRALRRADVAVSVAEAMDAARAAALVGVDRSTLRDALAAALVKDERARTVFLTAFDAVFPARAGDVAAERGRRARRGGGGGGGEGGGAGARGGAASAGPPAARSGVGAVSAREPTPRREALAQRSREGRERGDVDERRRAAGDDADAIATAVARDGREAASAGDPRADGEQGHGRDDGVDPTDAAREGDTREDDATRTDSTSAPSRLLRLSFRMMTPRDVEDCAELVRAIATRVTARVRRRLAPRPTGRLDFRRTIRAAVPRAGVPFERHYRGRRPSRPDLVALVDLSASTATATDFFLTLLAPATAYFRRVRLFGFVDRLVEIEFVAGQVRPAAPLDLMARSDFGRVLRGLVDERGALLGANTVLVVLGDARNNRRPPRADLLAAARARVRRVLWLNPDPRERWNTGDSVIAVYARHADAVVPCASLADLERALAAVAKL